MASPQGPLHKKDLYLYKNQAPAAGRLYLGSSTKDNGQTTHSSRQSLAPNPPLSALKI